MATACSRTALTRRAEARQTGMAKVILPSQRGDMLCLLGSIRAFGWYVALTAPLDEIQQPSYSLLGSLLAVSLPIMLLVALAALFMLIRTLRPLKLLTRKTRQLAGVDFAAPDALDRQSPSSARGCRWSAVTSWGSWPVPTPIWAGPLPPTSAT